MYSFRLSRARLLQLSFLPLTFVMISLFTASPVRAQALTFSLTNNVLPGAAGQTVTFQGTLSNDEASNTIFINSLDTTFFDAPSATYLTVTASASLPVSLAAGTTYTGNIFDVVIAPDAVAFPLGGTVSLQGGFNNTTFTPIGSSQSFSVVPEAQTSHLMAMGIPLLLMSAVFPYLRKRS